MTRSTDTKVIKRYLEISRKYPGNVLVVDDKFGWPEPYIACTESGGKIAIMASDIKTEFNLDTGIARALDPLALLRLFMNMPRSSADLYKYKYQLAGLVTGVENLKVITELLEVITKAGDIVASNDLLSKMSEVKVAFDNAVAQYGSVPADSMEKISGMLKEIDLTGLEKELVKKIRALKRKVNVNYRKLEKEAQGYVTLPTMPGVSKMMHDSATQDQGEIKELMDDIIKSLKKSNKVQSLTANESRTNI